MLPCCLTTPGPDTRIPSFQYPASVRNACNTQGVGGRDEDCRWPTLVHRGSTIHTRRLQQSLLPHRGIPLQDSSKEDLPHWRGEKGRGPSRKGIVVNAAISEHSPPKSDGTNVESERYEKYRRQNSGRKVGVASRGWGHALYLDAHRTTGKLSIGGMYHWRTYGNEKSCVKGRIPRAKGSRVVSNLGHQQTAQQSSGSACQIDTSFKIDPDPLIDGLSRMARGLREYSM